MVVPAVYIFSGEAGMSQGGAGLMFITLPKVFSQMAGDVLWVHSFYTGIVCRTDKFRICHGSNCFDDDGPLWAEPY